MQQTTMSRPPRPPQPQQQSLMSVQQQSTSTLALLRSGNTQRAGSGLSTIPRAPAIPSLLVNQGTPGSSLQSLKDQADHMLQQQRTDQKNREEMAHQLKLKEAEIQRLTQLVHQQTQTNNELTTQLQKSDERVQEIQHKIGFLDKLHNDLLMALHQSGEDLRAGRGEASDLTAKCAEQEAAIERLAAAYKQLDKERSTLHDKYEQALIKAQEAELQARVAAENERLLNDLLARGKAAEEQLEAQARALEVKCQQLERQLADATDTAAHLANQLPLQIDAAKQEVEARMTTELQRLQAELADAQALLIAAAAESTKQTGEMQEQAAALDAVKSELQKELAAQQVLSSQVDELQQQLGSAKASLKAEQDNTEAVKAALATVTAELAQVKSRSEELKCKLEAEQEDLSAQQDLMAKMVSDHVAALADAAELAKQHEALKQAQEELTAQLASAKQQMEEQQQAHASALQEMSTHKDAVQQQLDESQAQVTGLTSELQGVREQLAAAVEEQKKVLADKASSSALMKQQIESRVHKAVEENSKQAARTIEDIKKKAAAELKKAQDEVKTLTSKVAALNKAANTSKAQADKADKAHAAALAAAVEAAVKEAVQQERDKAAEANQAAGQQAVDSLRAENAQELEQLKKQLAAQHTAEQKAKNKEFESRLSRMEADVSKRLKQQQAEHAAALQQALATSKAEVAASRDEQLQALQQQLSSRGQQFSELQGEHDKLQEQLTKLNEELAASRTAAEQLRKENDKLKDASAANADGHVEVKMPGLLHKSRAQQPPPAYHAGNGNTKAGDAAKQPEAVRVDNKRRPAPSKQVSTGLYADMSDMETEQAPRTGLGGLFTGTTPQAGNKRAKVAYDDVVSKLHKAGGGGGGAKAGGKGGSLFGAAGGLFNGRASIRDPAASTQAAAPSSMKGSMAGGREEVHVTVAPPPTLDLNGTQEAPVRRGGALNRRSAGAKTLPRKSAGNARGRLKMMSTQEAD